MRRVTRDIPIKLRLDKRDGDMVMVSLLRTDKEDPHSLCLQFTLSREDLRGGAMTFVVYNVLRDEMLELLGREGSGGKGRKLGRTKKNRVVS